MTPRGTAAARRLVESTLCLALLGGSGACARDPTSDEARRFERATMAEIAEAVTLAFPLTSNEARLREPGARETFRRSLETLAASANALEAHGRRREAPFRYLSHSLATDAKDALRRLERNQDAEAQFVLQQLVDDCVACHSRLPDPDDSELGLRLLAATDLARLDLVERARLESAARQFDAALATYELLFASGERPPGQLDLEGLLVDYLILSVRVKDDLRRPRVTFSSLLDRPDVPGYLEEDLRPWNAALGALENRARVGDPLAEARVLVRDAHLEDASSFDRRGLVHALVASGLAHRFVSQHPEPSPEAGEAYWLLGLTETRVRHSFWLSEAEVYLESAIRAAPETVHAELAYALLEAETVAGYTGSAGVHLPDEVRRQLDELRELLDAPRAAPSNERP